MFETAIFSSFYLGQCEDDAWEMVYEKAWWRHKADAEKNVREYSHTVFNTYDRHFSMSAISESYVQASAAYFE